MEADSVVESSVVRVSKSEVDDGLVEVSVTDGDSDEDWEVDDSEVSVGSSSEVVVVVVVSSSEVLVGDSVDSSLVPSLVGSEVESSEVVGVSSEVDVGGVTVGSGVGLIPVPWRLTRAYRSWTTGASAG